jgi:hypothetical protein
VIGIATLTRTAAGVLDDEVDWAAGWIPHLILVCALVADRDRVERRLEHLLLLLHLYLSCVGESCVRGETHLERGQIFEGFEAG